jgi:hypothetical protein
MFIQQSIIMLMSSFAINIEREKKKQDNLCHLCSILLEIYQALDCTVNKITGHKKNHQQQNHTDEKKTSRAWFHERR